MRAHQRTRRSPYRRTAYGVSTIIQDSAHDFAALEQPEVVFLCVELHHAALEMPYRRLLFRVAAEVKRSKVAIELRSRLSRDDRIGAHRKPMSDG
jgi:hypothetical protein